METFISKSLLESASAPQAPAEDVVGAHDKTGHKS